VNIEDGTAIFIDLTITGTVMGIIKRKTIPQDSLSSQTELMVELIMIF
jgi:hypothetical protein